MAHMRHYTKTFRFADGVGVFLEAEAKRQNRSVNNLVETLVLNSFEYRTSPEVVDWRKKLQEGKIIK